MSADKAFLDTNVLVYAYSATETDKRDRARELKDAAPSCISTQVINEFIAVAWRKVGIPIDDVRAIVQNLCEAMPIIETGKPVILRIRYLHIAEKEPSMPRGRPPKNPASPSSTAPKAFTHDSSTRTGLPAGGTAGRKEVRRL